MSTISHHHLWQNTDISANDTTTQVLMRAYDSYQIVGSTLTNTGSFTVQNSIDANNWYSSTNQVIFTTSGDFFGQFYNDNEYIRIRADQDTSGLDLIVTARKGD